MSASLVGSEMCIRDRRSRGARAREGARAVVGNPTPFVGRAAGLRGKAPPDSAAWGLQRPP
eukprot:15186069-Alexandrium_andersonii.AAC.1